MHFRNTLHVSIRQSEVPFKSYLIPNTILKVEQDPNLFFFFPIVYKNPERAYSDCEHRKCHLRVSRGHHSVIKQKKKITDDSL